MSSSVWYLSFSKKKIEFKKYPGRKKTKRSRKDKSEKTKNLLIFLMFSLGIIFSLNLISAAPINDTLHLNLQTTFSNGSIETGTFTFAFNLTESSSPSCLGPVVYNHSTSLTTDSRGIVSITLPTSGSGGGNLSTLSFDKQYYLCYYRDGTLKDVSQIGRVPYSFRATQVNLSEISIDSNLSLGNFNVSASSGFFSFLGSLVNRITKIFATDVDISNNLTVGGNLTVDSGTLFVDSNRNTVGIGTITPRITLVVSNTQNQFGLLDSDNPASVTTGGTLFSSNDGLFTLQGVNSTGSGSAIRFAVNQTSGNVGIGTTSPADKLTVVGTLNVTDIQLASNCADGQILKWSGGVGTCGTDDTGGGGGNPFDQVLNTTSNVTFNRLNLTGGWLNVSITESQISDFQSYILTSNEGNLNVNSSDFWDGLNTPADITGLIDSQIDDDLTANYSKLIDKPANIDEDSTDDLTTSTSWGGDLSGTGSSPTVINTQGLSASNITSGEFPDARVSDSISINQNGSVNWAALNNYPTGCGAGQAVQVINDTLTCVNITDAQTLDGFDSTFFMPLNTSVFGDFDFNNGWQNGGFSIVGGDIYAQTLFVYNLTSLNVTQQDLSIIDDLIVFGNTGLKKNLTVDSGTLFVNSNMGRVGIGTTSPQNLLNVVGTGNVTGILYLGTQGTASGQAIHAGRTLTAGSGLTGGGDLTVDRTFNVGAGTGIIVNANDVAVNVTYLSDNYIDEAQAAAGQLTGTYPNPNLASAVAGIGLTGAAGSPLAISAGWGLVTDSGTDTINLSSSTAGTGLAYSSGILSVNTASGLTTSGDDVILASTTAGSGLTYTTGVLDIGAGQGITVNADDVAIAFGTNFLGWGNLTNYPTGCGAGQAVQVIGDTLTCVDVDPANAVNGSGTANTITKFTSANTIGDSLITDDGVIVAVDTSDLFINTSSGNLGINTTSPSDTLTVVGTLNVTDIQLASNCADGQILKWASGVGTCGTDDSGGGGGDQDVNTTSNVTFNRLNLTGGWGNVTITESQITDLFHNGTTDTNETSRFNFLVNNDCSSGDLVIGIQANGTVLCATDADSGNDNIFDQILNTTSNVTFNEINVSLIRSNDWTNVSITESQISDFQSYILTSNEGNLNVNSSDFWDGLNTPSDISTGDLTDDNTYLQVVGDTGTGNFIFNQNFTVDSNTLFVDSNLNRVGIGTTSPQDELHINASGAGIRLTDPADAGYVALTIDSNGFGRLISFDSGIGILSNNVEVLRVTGGAVGINDTTPDASLEIVNDGSGDSFLVADTGDGDATPFVIQGDGDVGIGTTSPSSKLEVSGDIELTNLFDNDASNFFDGGCSADQYISGIDSTGAITCAADSGTGTMSSWTIAGDTGSTAVSDGQTVTIAGSGTIDTSEVTRTVTLSVQADSIGDTQLAFNTGQTLTTSGTPTFSTLTLTGTGTALTSAGDILLTGSGDVIDFSDDLADKIYLHGTDFKIGVESGRGTVISAGDIVTARGDTGGFQVLDSSSVQKFLVDTSGNVQMDGDLTVSGGNVGIGVAPDLNYSLRTAGDILITGGDILFTDNGVSNRDHISYNDSSFRTSAGTFVFHADTSLGTATFSPTAAISAEDAYFSGDLNVDGGDIFDAGTTPWLEVSGCGANTGVSSVNSAGTITCTADSASDNYGSWILAGTSGTPQTISSGNTATIAAGAGITTTAGATDTVTVVATLGTSIVSGEITDNTIQAVDLEATNTEVDNDIITFDSASGGFTFNSCAEISGLSAGLCDGTDDVNDAIASISDWQTACTDCVQTNDIGDILDASHITDIYVLIAGDTMDGSLTIGQTTGEGLTIGDSNCDSGGCNVEIEDGSLCIGSAGCTASAIEGSLLVEADVTISGNDILSSASTIAISMSNDDVSVVGCLNVGSATECTAQGNLQLSADIIMTEDDFIGIGSTTERIEFNGGSGRLEILGANLDLNNNDILAVDKITVVTVDPLYTIGENRYSTYLPAMVGGVKEEVTGTIMLNSNYTIDFDSLEVGSNLWVFYQTTDFGLGMENLQVILTPSFNGNVWYEKNPVENTMTIHGNQAGEVSYRFTANRFDWSNWGTLYLEDDNQIGLIVPMK